MSDVSFILGKKVASPSPKDRALHGLQMAVQVFNAADKISSAVTYHFGESAYEGWARDLHELDYPGDVEKPHPKEPEWYDMSQMIWQRDAIERGSAAAATFCRTAAGVLPEAAAHLNAAAKFYDEEVGISKSTFGLLANGTKEQREKWLSSEAKREAGVQAIKQMLEKERGAVAEIEKALTAMK